MIGRSHEKGEERESVSGLVNALMIGFVIVIQERKNITEIVIETKLRRRTVVVIGIELVIVIEKEVVTMIEITKIET